MLGFLIFVCGIFVGFNVYKIYVTVKAKKILDEIAARANDIQQENTCEIVFEKHENLIYAYKAADRSFVTQGATMDDIREDLRTRFPEVSFKANSKNMEEVTK